MILTLLTRELRQALKRLKPIAPKTSQGEPVSVRMEADASLGQRISLQVTDPASSISMTVFLRASKAGHGDSTTADVHLGKLDQIVGLVQQDYIDIDISGKEQVKVTAAGSEWQLSKRDDAVIPILQGLEPTSLDHILFGDSMDFEALLSSVEHSVCVESARIALCGIEVSFAKKEAVAAATDGRRLAVATCEASRSAVTKSALIPRNVLPFLHPRFEGAQLALYVRSNEVVAWWSIDGQSVAELVFSQLNGKFPDYHAVMPAESKIGSPYVHDLSALSHAIRQVEFMVDHETCRMTVDYRQTGLHLSAQSQSGKCQVVIPCDVAVEAQSNFNPKYLLDALKAIKTQEVTTYLTTTGQMVLKSDKLTQLLMPLG